MTAPGETDLVTLLESLSVTRRPGVYVIVSPTPPIDPAVEADAIISEEEGPTVVCTQAVAEQQGWGRHDGFAWLTLAVHSSLHAVGLTAAVAGALAAADVPCNVLAGHFHDHLLVPVDLADTAVAALAELADG